MKFPLFGCLYDLSLFPFIRSVRRAMADLAFASGCSMFLDICCGTGNQLHYLRKAGVGGFGIDSDPSMLRKASAAGCSVSMQDAADMGIRTSSFGGAMITLSLHDKDEKTCRLILEEAARILRPGGVLFVCDFDITDRTGIFAKLVINFFERAAGGDHFRNFLKYRPAGLAAVVNEELPFRETGSMLLCMESIKILSLEREN